MQAMQQSSIMLHPLQIVASGSIERALTRLEARLECRMRLLPQTRTGQLT
jgi:hypothetical protein